MRSPSRRTGALNFDTSYEDSLYGALADLPDIEADRSAFDIIGWHLEPGDAVFFHMLTLHAAGAVGNGRRRVLSVRFLGDDVRHAPRNWKTSPSFPGLEQELPAGEPMAIPSFPFFGKNVWGGLDR